MPRLQALGERSQLCYPGGWITTRATLGVNLEQTEMTKVHHFFDTREAYDACQTHVHPRTMAKVETGHILLISERSGNVVMGKDRIPDPDVVIGLADTWPVAITKRHEGLHTADWDHKDQRDWVEENMTSDLVEALIDACAFHSPALSDDFWSVYSWWFEGTTAGEAVFHEIRVNYPPEGDVKLALATLGYRSWNPQAIDTLISMREQLDVEIYPMMTTDGEKAVLHNMINEIDKALVGHHKSLDAATLRLQSGHWDYDNPRCGEPGRWEATGTILLPNTIDSVSAAALIMQLSVQDVKYGLEEEGEVSTNKWCLDYVSENHQEPALEDTNIPEFDADAVRSIMDRSGDDSNTA